MNLLKYDCFDAETLVLLAAKVPESKTLVEPLVQTILPNVIDYCLKNYILLDVDLKSDKVAYLNGKMQQMPKKWVLETYLREYMDGYLDSNGDPIEMQILIQKAINQI